MTVNETSLTATIIAAHGRQYRILLADGQQMLAHPRGKKSLAACGDRVIVQTCDHLGEGAVIQTILPRSSLLYRSDLMREKLIAANVSQIAIVIATEPSFSGELLTRCLVAAESQHIKGLIILNKNDLSARLGEARQRLEIYQALHYPVVELSARHDITPLIPYLRGESSVFVGQSGMGKTTLINALIPGTNAATREISAALDAGKHTTTHAELYQLDEHSSLIDSPGLQEFGLSHLQRGTLEQAFPEFRLLLGHCRFRDCRHDQEPGCALQQAVCEGKIDASRFASYQLLRDEFEAKLRREPARAGLLFPENG